MPSKYGKQYTVPKEFPSVLKSFTREVLRAQPSDIYEFGAQYFTELLAQAEAAQAAENAAPKRLSPLELEQLLTQMFAEADTDGSGALDKTEFKNVLAMCDLGLSDKEVRRVMGEADFNEDGEISYEEFIPLAVELVGSMYAKMEAEYARQHDEDEAREEASTYLLHGMTKQQVEDVMLEIFEKSDLDGSGALSLQEFRKCCKDADIGLTKKEINILMHQSDVDGDGQITYEEFVPLCFEMLTEILKDELLAEKRSPTELEVFLTEVWKEVDYNDTGMLSPIELKDSLRRADLGLSRLQIHSVLSEFEFDEHGMCDFSKFAAKAAELIYRLVDPAEQMVRYDQIEQLREGTDFTIVHGLGQADIESVLRQEFATYDTEGKDELAVVTVTTALKSSQLALSSGEVSAIMSAAEMTASGGVDYISLSSYAFYVLQYLAQQAALSS